MALQRGLIKARTIGEKRRVGGAAVLIAVCGQAVSLQTQTAARFMQEDVASGNVPLAGGWREFGVEVGFAFGNGAEFEGAATADVLVVAEVAAEVIAHAFPDMHARGDDGERRWCGAAMQAAGVAVRVRFVRALTVQCVPVVTADRGVDKAKRRAVLLDAGDDDAELPGVFDEFARAVDGVNQPVVVRRILVNSGIGFFAQAGKVDDAWQFAGEEIMRGKIGFGKRGVVTFLLDVVAIRLSVERQNRCPGFLSESSDLLNQVLRVSAQKLPVRHFFWYRVFR